MENSERYLWVGSVGSGRGSVGNGKGSLRTGRGSAGSGKEVCGEYEGSVGSEKEWERICENKKGIYGSGGSEEWWICG